VIVRSRTAFTARSTIVEAARQAARDLDICVALEVAEAGIDIGKIAAGYG
jgi:di/tripeptidase